MSQRDPSLSQVSDLIEAVYATVSDAELWPQVLQRIGDCIGGTQTLLFLSHANGSDVALRCRHTTDEVLYPFLEHYRFVNVLAEPCDRMFKDGAPRFSHLALPDLVFERSEFYQDFFRRQDLYYSLGLKNQWPDSALAYLSVQRPWSAAPFSETEGQILALLMPHIRQAVLMHGRLQGAVRGRKMAEDVLRAYGRAVIGVNDRGTIDYASADAEELLREGTILFQREGRLHARNACEDRRLQEKLRDVLNFGEDFVSRPQETLMFRGPEAEGDVQAVLLPHRSQGVMDTGVRAAISISRACDVFRSRGEVLGALYRLSATERLVADLLLTGANPREIAGTLQLTLETTRFYVKQILGKTGTRRQVDLIRLMLSLPAKLPG